MTASAPTRESAGGPVDAGLAPSRLVWLPLAMIGALASFVALPRVHGNPHMLVAFAGTAGALLAWQMLLWFGAKHRGRTLAVEWASPVKQHYIQACVQSCLYAYWGWHWLDPEGHRPILLQLPLVLAQWFFVYAFDALLAWTRGRSWRLGSGPTPIVLSTNLFIWFRDDWFVWQFAMVAAGVLGKEFVKWNKEGRRTHVFNPSGFGLAVTAIALIATGNVDLTWAKELATTLERPPHVFLFLFCLGLVVQHFFAVTLMTLAAAAVMAAIVAGYTWSTGVYLFASTNMPAAAFLGLHLLMTDPSTSPRTNLGRLWFGAGYGLGYVVFFQLLSAIGAPELFAKLFPVPVLNTCVRWLDRLATSGAPGRLNERWQTAASLRATNAVHMAVWASLFAVMYLTGQWGFFRGPHPGDSIAFWKRALAEGRPDAAHRLTIVAGNQAWGHDSPDAYNELGVLTIERRIVHNAEATALKSASSWWARAARLGSLEACSNIAILDLYFGVRGSDQDLAVALRKLRAAADAGSRGLPRFLVGMVFEGAGDARQALFHYQRCGERDLFAVKGLARGVLAEGRRQVGETMLARLDEAAKAGDGEACFYLAHLHAKGLAGARDDDKARELLHRASELGFAGAAAVKPDATIPPYAPPPRSAMVRPGWATAFPEVAN